jgi:hypothetical protein
MKRIYIESYLYRIYIYIYCNMYIHKYITLQSSTHKYIYTYIHTYIPIKKNSCQTFVKTCGLPFFCRIWKECTDYTLRLDVDIIHASTVPVQYATVVKSSFEGYIVFMYNSFVVSVL